MSKEDLNKDGQGFSGDEKKNDSFGLPENYFESFSSRLFKKIEAEDELKDYPLLSSVGKINPFAIPAGYFELRDELNEHPSLQNLKAVNFTVPANYFETLTASILNKIEVVEEVKAYTTLASVDKQNSYAVPEKYFEKFSPRIETREAKVISIFTRVKTTYKVAMAAAVALFVTLSVLYYDHKGTSTGQNIDADCHTLACLSKKEILNSNYLQTVSEENIIEMIDVKALSDSLSLKEKNGKIEKIGAEEISEEVDVNTLTEEL
ncbi:MAG: hypothetical protein ACXVPN_12430 [Bacteroidia bacterium]